MNNEIIVPIEVIDLIRFLCATWTQINNWAYENSDAESLFKYPVIQGMKNQLDLQRIGGQSYDIENVRKAVNWVIEHEASG